MWSQLDLITDGFGKKTVDPDPTYHRLVSVPVAQEYLLGLGFDEVDLEVGYEAEDVEFRVPARPGRTAGRRG